MTVNAVPIASTTSPSSRAVIPDGNSSSIRVAAVVNCQCQMSVWAWSLDGLSYRIVTSHSRVAARFDAVTTETVSPFRMRCRRIRISPLERALDDEVRRDGAEEVDHLSGDAPGRPDFLVDRVRDLQQVAADHLGGRRESESREGVPEDVRAPVRLGHLEPAALREGRRGLGRDEEV